MPNSFWFVQSLFYIIVCLNHLFSIFFMLSHRFIKKNALSECVTFLFQIIISSKVSTFAKALLPHAASCSHIYKPA